MRTASAKRFACPECKGDLLLSAVKKHEDQVVEGSLRCEPCARNYPIINEVPRFITEINPVEEHSAKSFGFKWEKIGVIDNYLTKAFYDELPPLDYKNSFKGKSVLDAGTGMGVPSYCMSSLGAEEIFGIDIATTIEIAQKNTRSLPNVTIAQADIYKIPFKKNSFDIVVCVAVLQHLRDPKKAFEELLSYVKPGGKIVVWMYGRENNGFAHYFIEPFRKLVTRRLPLPIVMALSSFLAVIFQFVAKCIYQPLTRLGVKGLPSQTYITDRGDYNYNINRYMIFDQLLAPLSYLFRKDEVESLFQNPEISSYQLRHHTENSWTGIGVTKSQSI